MCFNIKIRLILLLIVFNILYFLLKFYKIKHKYSASLCNSISMQRFLNVCLIQIKTLESKTDYVIFNRKYFIIFFDFYSLKQFMLFVKMMNNHF